jgi:hypothetical protein
MSNSNGDNKPVEKERITNAQFEQIQRRREAEFYLDFVKNEATSRIEWIRKLNGGNERKNIDEECEYPDSIGASDYKATYDRLAIANRLVNIFPQECWAMLPDIYETENLSQVTKFEKEWEVLNEELNVLSKIWISSVELDSMD